MENGLNELIKNGLKDLMPNYTSKTIVGEEIVMVDGSKVFPVIKVSAGYVGGGGEYTKKKNKSEKLPCALGLSYGSVCEPIGFFVAGKTFEFVPIKEDNSMLEIVKKVSDAFCVFVKSTCKASVKKSKEKSKNAKK